MAILLIGSTGSGKSSLGNFLLDPSENNREYFTVARTNMPETKGVQSMYCEVKERKYLVIDTPGLNESDIGDLEHMIEIIECLNQVDSVVACLLVVKFTAKIDAQYKATVQYYRKLLPSLFARNVIIVMSDFATDDRSLRMREKREIDVDKIVDNIKMQIKESASLDYKPMLFSIDSDPYGAEERQLNQDVRSAIFSKLASLKRFPVRSVKLAKTEALIKMDKETIDKHAGKISGYNERLQQVNAQAADGLRKIQHLEIDKNEIQRELKGLQNALADKDSDEQTSIGDWSVRKEWKLFRTIELEFEKTTKFEIESIERWTNGRCRWIDYEQTEHKIRGKIKGKFMRGVYASLTLYTSRRNKYKKEIASLKQQSCEVQARLRFVQQDLKEVEEEYKEYTEDIKLLEDYIERTQKLIEDLSPEYVPLREARGKLEELKVYMQRGL